MLGERTKASLMYLLPNYSRYESEKAPQSLAEPQRLAAPFTATYPQAGVLSDLDDSGLARGETSKARDDLHIAPCGREGRQPGKAGNAPLEKFPCPDLAAALAGTASELRVLVTAHPASYSGPSTNLAKELLDSRTILKQDHLKNLNSVVRNERYVKLAVEWAEKTTGVTQYSRDTSWVFCLRSLRGVTSVSRLGLSKGRYFATASADDGVGKKVAAQGFSVRVFGSIWTGGRFKQCEGCGQTTA